MLLPAPSISGNTGGSDNAGRGRPGLVFTHLLKRRTGSRLQLTIERAGFRFGVRAATWHSIGRRRKMPAPGADFQLVQRDASESGRDFFLIG